MNAITDEQLFDLLVDTAKRCSSAVISLSDEELEYNLFEEFDVGVRSFLHDDSVSRLVEAGMLSNEAIPICHSIRGKWIELDMRNWTIAEIRVHPDWKHIHSACDTLLELLELLERHD